jgi:hypothetical protein
LAIVWSRGGIAASVCVARNAKTTKRKMVKAAHTDWRVMLGMKVSQWLSCNGEDGRKGLFPWIAV